MSRYGSARPPIARDHAWHLRVTEAIRQAGAALEALAQPTSNQSPPPDPTADQKPDQKADPKPHTSEAASAAAASTAAAAASAAPYKFGGGGGGGGGGEAERLFREAFVLGSLSGLDDGGWLSDEGGAATRRCVRISLALHHLSHSPEHLLLPKAILHVVEPYTTIKRIIEELDGSLQSMIDRSTSIFAPKAEPMTVRVVCLSAGCAAPDLEPFSDASRAFPTTLTALVVTQRKN